MKTSVNEFPNPRPRALNMAPPAQEEIMNIVVGIALFILAVVLIIFIVEFLIPRGIVTLGKKDTWWSPFRTLPPPGEMYIVVRGDPKGPFADVLESVSLYNYKNGEFEALPDGEKKGEGEGYLYNLGVARVGFFRYLLYREVKYDKWEMLEKDKKPTGEWGLVPKTRPGPSIFFRYNMAVGIKAAETAGNLTVDAILVFTAQVVNPQKAFFFAGGWEGQTTAAVAGAFRQYAASRNVDELRLEQKGSEASPLVETLKALGDRTKPESLYNKFGVEIVDARFVSFDLVEGEEARATKAVAIAKLDAEAAKERGIGEKNASKERAEGIRAELAAWASQPNGAAIAMAEAIKVAKPNVIGGGIVTAVSDKG